MTWQRAIAFLIVALFVGPLLFGLAGTFLPATGLVSLASTAESGNGFAVVMSDPRFVSSIGLTLKTGVVATILVLLLAVVTLVSAHDTRLWRWISASMPPLLAVPHAAIAVGLVYLIAPSGWLVRLVSPVLTGWQRPPTSWVVPDADGWSLILGLLIKETPFLLLTATAQLATLNIDASLHIGRTLGYSPARCWSRLILPQLYPRIRLTLFIILAFNLSVVDMAILLGPGTPPTFSVLLLSMVNDPGSRSAASAGALLLGILVLLVFAAVYIVEYFVARITRYRRQSGARGRSFGSWRRMGQLMTLLMLASSVLSLLMLLIWSVTRRWRFPDVLPTAWSPGHWAGRGEHLLQPAMTTLSLAVFTAILAVLTAIAWLELERLGHVRRLDWLWYVPLLIPQVSLMFGWQAAALLTASDGVWLTVAHAHWLYALPYVVLILAVAWRELDPGWNHAAATLGAGYWRILWKVRLPFMLRPLCQAAAVAVAVSVAQYLPTLLLGAGRHQTLAIELVTSFGGVDRRVIASLAVLQSLLPLLAFILALAAPRWRGIRRQQGSDSVNSYAGPN